MRVRRIAGVLIALLAAAACANLDGIAGGNGATPPLPDTGPVASDDGASDAPTGVVDSSTATDEVKVLLGQLGGVGNLDAIGGEARFDSPSSMTKDAAGNIYVVDGVGTLIRKIAAGTNAVTTLAGAYRISATVDGVGLNARFEGVSSIAFDGQNTLYLAQPYAGCRIRAIDLLTSQVRTVIPAPCQADRLVRPLSIRWNAADSSLYILDDGRLQRMTAKATSYELTTVCGKLGVGLPVYGDCATAYFPASSDFVFASSTTLYSRTDNGDIVKVDIPGNSVSKAGGFDKGGGGIAIRGPTELLLGAYQSIHDFSLNSGLAPVFTGSEKVNPIDGPLTEAGFESIAGILGEDNGSYLVTDHATVRRVSSAGVTTLAGRARTFAYADGTGPDVKLGPVSALAQDSTGRVFFYDCLHGVVRSFDRATGTVKRIAGLPDVFAGEDGGVFDKTSDASLVFDGQYLVLFDPFDYLLHFIDPATGAIVVQQEVADGFGFAGASDGKGRIFATTFSNHGIVTLKKGDLTGASLVNLTATNGTPAYIRAICYDAPLNALFVTEGVDKAVLRIQLDADGGSAGVSVIGSGFVSPDGIACDGKGHVYVTEYYRSTITRVDAVTGKKTVIAGVDNHAAFVPGPLPASLNNPSAPLFIDDKHLLVGSRNEAVLVSIPLPAE